MNIDTEKSGKTGSRLSPLGRLDVRLGLLCLLLFLPLIINDFFTIRDWQQKEIVASQEELYRLAKTASREHFALIASTKDLLSALSRVEDIRGEDLEACTKTLTQVARDFSKYTLFAKTNPDGVVVCSSTVLEAPVDLSSSPTVVQAMRTGEFAVGRPKIGQISGMPIIGFSYPIFDDDQKLAGLINTGLNLDWLDSFMADLNPSKDIEILFFNSRGRVLASVPPRPGASESISDTGIYRLVMDRREGVGEAEGTDGKPVFCGFTNLKGAPGELFLIAYIAKKKALESVSESGLQRYFIYAFTLLAAFIIAWLAVRSLVLKWVRGLLEHSQRLAAGDVGSRSGLPHNNTEMGRLAETFDNMSEKIKAREDALRESSRNLSGLFNAIGESVILVNIRGDILAANRIAAERLGIDVEWMVGRTFEELLPLENVSWAKKMLAQIQASKNPVKFKEESGGRIYDGVIYPIFDDDGDIEKAVVFAQDVTERVKVERSLVESQKSLSKSQDMARLGNWSWDIETNKVVWSQAMFRFLEVNPEDIPETYETLLLLVHPDDREMVKRTLSESIFEEKGADIEHRMVKPYGGEIHVHTITDIIYRDINEPAGLMGTVQDITEWKLAENRLRESEARIWSILDTAAEGIITIDDHGVIETFNRAAEAIFGYSSGEVIGRKVNLLMPEPHRTEHDNYLASYINSGRRKIIGMGREVEGRKKNGGSVPLDLSVSEVILGNRRLFTGMLRDISERKAAESALKKSKASLAKAQELAKLGNWDWDAETGTVFWSDEIYQLFGLEPKDVKAGFDAYLTICQPQDRDDIRERMRIAIKDGVFHPMEHRINRPDGEIRYVSDQGEVIKGPDGKTLRMVGTVQDVTERKTAEIELRIKESAIQSSINAIVLAGLDGRTTYVNASFRKLWGFEDAEEALGRPFQSFFAGEGSPLIRDLVFHEGAWFGELPAFTSAGKVFQVQVSASMVTDDKNDPICIMASMVDITDQKMAEEQLRIQAIYDALTGLYNRRRFMDALEVMIKEARRHNLVFCTCICDLDHFKGVNDNYGHLAGDEVLSSFGGLLTETLRAEDVAGRYGGEEFAIAFPHTDEKSAGVVLERIRVALENMVFTSHDGASFKVTASFGLSQFQPDDNEVRLLDRADEALYRAKEKGRNRIETG